MRPLALACTILVLGGWARAAEVLDGPTLTMNPTGLTPLAGVVEMLTDEPVGVILHIGELGDTPRMVEFPEPTMSHSMPVLGLKAGRTYSVEVELMAGGSVGILEAVTAPLPEDFPIIDVNVSIPERMEPGFTLLDCFFRSPGDARPRYTIILDPAGEVVWYSTICNSNMGMQPNGKLLYANFRQVIESDLLGNEVHLARMDSDDIALHHEFQRTVAGTYISVGRVTVPDVLFPSSDTDPGAPLVPADVLDEPAVEFLPDGSLRNSWSLYEMIDPLRIGYDSLRPTANGYDWVHANAVFHDPSDDTFIMSIRHQDAVVKFSRNTGEIKWILGPHDNWPPEFEPYLLNPVGSPFEWQYHQHAPMVTTPGRLVLFDNGNRRASPFDGTTPLTDAENYSRAVEYEIDESNMKVRQVWEWKDVAAPLYANFIGDADFQPTTQNVLITFGGVSFLGGESTETLGLGIHARIIEVEHVDDAEKVFEVALHDPDGGRLAVYRSERIPALYPQPGATPTPPNGVGDTLQVEKGNGVELSWAPSPVDGTHDAAEYYAVYASTSPSGGFAMKETSAGTGVNVTSQPAIEFFKVVAVNLSGTSGDEPAP